MLQAFSVEAVFPLRGRHWLRDPGHEQLATGGEPAFLIPIGKPERVSIVGGEPPDLSSILASLSEAPLSRRFVLCLVPVEGQAGMDLVPRSIEWRRSPVRLIAFIIAL